MPYAIEWKPNGAIKRFSGTVGFEDVLRSEQEISSSPNFTSLRFVISDYSNAEYGGLTESQRLDINALRIGGYMVNKHIKYAFILKNPEVQVQIQHAVGQGLMLYETRVFDQFQEAGHWVGLTA